MILFMIMTMMVMIMVMMIGIIAVDSGSAGGLLS